MFRVHTFCEMSGPDEHQAGRGELEFGKGRSSESRSGNESPGEEVSEDFSVRALECYSSFRKQIS